MKIKNLIKTFTVLSVICGLQVTEGFTSRPSWFTPGFSSKIAAGSSAPLGSSISGHTTSGMSSSSLISETALIKDLQVKMDTLKKDNVVLTNELTKTKKLHDDLSDDCVQIINTTCGLLPESRLDSNAVMMAPYGNKATMINNAFTPILDTFRLSSNIIENTGIGSFIESFANNLADLDERSDNAAVAMDNDKVTADARGANLPFCPNEAGNAFGARLAVDGNGSGEANAYEGDLADADAFLGAPHLAGAIHNFQKIFVRFYNLHGIDYNPAHDGPLANDITNFDDVAHGVNDECTRCGNFLLSVDFKDFAFTNINDIKNSRAPSIPNLRLANLTDQSFFDLFTSIARIDDATFINNRNINEDTLKAYNDAVNSHIYHGAVIANDFAAMTDPERDTLKRFYAYQISCNQLYRAVNFLLHTIATSTPNI